MTNPPLDPPPTEAELIWWRSERRRRLVVTGGFLMTVCGLTSLALVAKERGLGPLLHHPALMVRAFLIGGTTLSAFVLIGRSIERRLTKAPPVDRMGKALRERRLRDALLALPAESTPEPPPTP